MKKLIILAVTAFTILGASAQSPILKDVKIEFEKKVNTWAFFPEGREEQMRRNIPQYNSSFYNYESDGNKSIYTAIPTDKNPDRGFFRMQQDDNSVVYTDFINQKQISLKSVFEKTYLLTDSTGNIKWKITNDFREIAGFKCRRATALIMDSVFVVAFYTDEILGGGGPESFGGLPGTILGLVINRLHTTWYATKISVVDVDQSKIKPPVDSKAEKTDKKKLIENLQSRFQNEGGRRGFGNFRDQIIWNIMI